MSDLDDVRQYLDGDDDEVRDCDDCGADTIDGATCQADGRHRCEDCHALHTRTGTVCHDCED